MMEDNEQLLRAFFSEAAQQQIADEGFTKRVMQHLPSRINWFTRLWNAGCILVFAVLFVWLDGLQLLAVQLEVMLRTLATTSFSVNLLMLFSVLAGLLFTGAYEVICSGSYRRWV